MENTYIVILFYKFIHIDDPEALKVAHKEYCKTLGMKGRLLIAHEGINGTFEGTPEMIASYTSFLRSDPRFTDIAIKESKGTGSSFPKLTVKVRPEVVTLGAGTFDVQKETAKELLAEELQSWYQNDEDFVVLDLRNDYEIASGKFDKTIDPGLAQFRNLPEKISELAHLKDKKIVTVCTGGIRCEKATCLLKREGFSNMYQLKDGIHTYMKAFPGEHFKGSLFVFDNRLTTDVVENPEKTVIGTCFFCETTTEKYCSDDSVRPSRKILCCENCYETHREKLRQSVS